MLRALLDYAQRENLVAEPGFKLKTVRWLLVFSDNGRFLGVQDLASDDRKSRGRDFPACPDLTQPELVGAGARHFLVDGLEVVVLLTKDGDVGDKLTAKHDYFVHLLEQASSSVEELGIIATALRDGAILDTIRARLVEYKARPTDLATLAVSGASEQAAILVERNDWRDWWQSFAAQLAAERQARGSGKGRKSKGGGAALRMRCLLSGELVEPLSTHNKISGLSDVGGQGAGDVLAGFDKEAFRSFGFSQAANAAMGETMVKTYTTALNDVIKRRINRLAGAKVGYWYSGCVPENDDPLAEVLTGFGLTQPEDSNEKPAASVSTRERLQAESRAKRLLEAIRMGDRAGLSGLRYCALTLSANSGRVVIRDWMDGSFEELLMAVTEWFDDLTIVSLAGSEPARASRLETVVTSVLPERKRNQAYADWIKPIGSARQAFWRCALGGRKVRFPEEVIARLLIQQRVAMVNDEFSSCLDPSADHFALRRSRLYSRVSVLKAYFVRSTNGGNSMLTYLNEDLDAACYQFGRLVAVLADLQREALRKESGESVKASIVDRFYASASTSPRLVHGRLISLSNHHLRKLEQQGERGARAADAIRDRIAEISMRIDPNGFRSVMHLEEQSLFALGYYHQIAQMNRDRRTAAARKKQRAETDDTEEA